MYLKMGRLYMALDRKSTGISALQKVQTPPKLTGPYVIQFKFICRVLFTIQIVTKQLYRKLGFFNINSSLITIKNNKAIKIAIKIIKAHKNTKTKMKTMYKNKN